MKQKIYVILVIFTAINFCCVGTLKNIRPTALSLDEKEILGYNWKIAEQIAEYDFYSWIATDSLMQYKDKINFEAVKGWVVTKNSSVVSVDFGHLTDSVFTSVFNVQFKSKDEISTSLAQLEYQANNMKYSMFKVMSITREVFKNEFNSLNVSMNSYVIHDQNKYMVYFFPGSTDRHLAFCGGYKATYNANTLNLIDTLKMHKSPLLVEPQPDEVMLYRTSSKNKILNEVDIAQFLILKNWAPKQYVMTSDYIFILNWDQNTNDISMQTNVFDK